MKADTLAKAIRQLMPSKKALLDAGLSTAEADSIRAIYAVPDRRKRLSFDGNSALHDFLSRFDTSKLELPTLTFAEPRTHGSLVEFAKREADLLIADNTGISIVNHVTLERELVALDGDRFVQALIRLVRASRVCEAWHGRFNELLQQLLEDAGVPETDSTIWRGAIHPGIAASNNPGGRSRGSQRSR